MANSDESLDLKDSYLKAQSEIDAIKTYVALKDQYNEAARSVGNSFEEASSKLAESINGFSEKTKNIKQDVKSQFEELLDINKMTGGYGNSTKYITKLLIIALKNIKPKILEILIEEIINISGCDQNKQIGSSQATLTPPAVPFPVSPISVGYAGQVIYMDVNSVDIGGMLKINPNSKVGKIIYEPKPLEVQSNPFAMNKELNELIQTGEAYSTTNNTKYVGSSGQPLFDIQYVTEKTENNFTEQGKFFKITIINRIGIEGLQGFIRDYYSTIEAYEFQSVISRIFDAVLNCIKIEANIGVSQTKDMSAFSLLIARIFGLCLDGDDEINVSGISKSGELDGPINDSFFNLSPIDLRNIDQTVSNVQNKVVQFVDCGNVNIPVNSAQIIENLTQLNFVDGDALIKKAENLSNVISNDPLLKAISINANIKASIDTDFVKQMIQGLISALFSPKIILGLIIPLKLVNVDISFKTYVQFMKDFSKFVIKVIGRIGALLVKEIVDVIKKDLFNLLQVIIRDLAKEKADKRIIIVLKLILVLNTLASFISDYRKCKSVIDDILKFIKIALMGTPFDLPLPLLYACALLPGFSATRANINVIKELQKFGFNTGTLPSGAPNKDVLSKQSVVKGYSDEFAENNKVSIGLPPIPAALVATAPMPVPFGKCF